MFCTECGKKNHDDAKFCFNCGTRLAGSGVAGPSSPTTQVPFAPSASLPENVVPNIQTGHETDILMAFAKALRSRNIPGDQLTPAQRQQVIDLLGPSSTRRNRGQSQEEWFAQRSFAFAADGNFDLNARCPVYLHPPDVSVFPRF